MKIIDCIREQILSLLHPMFLVIFIVILWLYWWALLFTFACIIFIGQNTIVGFPTIQSLVLLVGLWTISAGRSLIRASTAGTILGWYKSGGNLSCNHFRWTILHQASLHNFGSIVFASIVVDASGILIWTLKQLNQLLYDSQPSALQRFATKLDQRANSSSYTMMFLEDSSLVDASHKANDTLQYSDIHHVLHSETLKYHVIFCSLQAFAVCLAATTNVIAAVIAAMVCLMMLGSLHGPVVSLLCCYAHDGNFFRSYSPQTVDAIQLCIRTNLRALARVSPLSSTANGKQSNQTV